MLQNASRPFRAMVLCALLLGAASAHADEKVLTQVLAACKGEISALCSKITPGNGRLIACLYANEDQLSYRCDLELFNAAVELQNIMGAMQRVAAVCKPDIELLCGKVESGEGRVMQCLKGKQKALSAPCQVEFGKAGIDIE